jgi:hypothetical protein
MAGSEEEEEPQTTEDAQKGMSSEDVNSGDEEVPQPPDEGLPSD